mmetsp:Transcript_137879/g.294654  ORF Transcript_137879/g.294654 Transcript_137879/m.294654 type:complete len:322 (+) Transcript_137879:675-1640(+)
MNGSRRAPSRRSPPLGSLCPRTVRSRAKRWAVAVHLPRTRAKWPAVVPTPVAPRACAGALSPHLGRQPQQQRHRCQCKGRRWQRRRGRERARARPRPVPTRPRTGRGASGRAAKEGRPLGQWPMRALAMQASASRTSTRITRFGSADFSLIARRRGAGRRIIFSSRCISLQAIVAPSTAQPSWIGTKTRWAATKKPRRCGASCNVQWRCAAKARSSPSAPSSHRPAGSSWQLLLQLDASGPALPTAAGAESALTVWPVPNTRLAAAAAAAPRAQPAVANERSSLLQMSSSPHRLRSSRLCSALRPRTRIVAWWCSARHGRP